MAIDILIQAPDVWIVGKINPDNHKEWEFQGAFNDRQAAIAACEDENYFIGPARLNNLIRKDVVDWLGGYYPVRGQDE